MPKIVLKIQRAGGSKVPMPNPGAPDTVYHFKPAADDPDGAHVAEVKNEAHAARFLSIDAYELHPDSAEWKPAPPKKEQKDPKTENKTDSGQGSDPAEQPKK